MHTEELLIAVLLAIAVGAAFVAVYQNAKKTAHLPRAPFGADAEAGPQEQRRWAESDV